MKMRVGVITVVILYADFLEVNENSIEGDRMSVTSGFWGIFLHFPIEVCSSRSNPHIHYC